VREGDVLVAMASSGLHSNGYSLVRHVLLQQTGWSLERHVDELGRTLGEELLEPTRIYALPCLELARHTDTHAMSHITGGGIAANLARVLPKHVSAEVARHTWTPQPIFDLVREVGAIQLDDLERTLNLGVGMIAVTAADDADEAINLLADAGLPAWVCGEVVGETGGEVTLTGSYAV
jgi:phosphoribosylformylglycinamidine cyclo-ligase